MVTMATITADTTPPSNPAWAIAELCLAVAIVVAGLIIPSAVFMAGSAPWLASIGLFLVWRRGPGWGALGLGRPTSPLRAVVVAALVGIAYQLVGTFVLEPAIARATSGEIPDVSAFRSIVGNEAQLLYWVAVAWTLGAVFEEVAYRGWIMTRFAEVGRFSSGAWMSAAAASSLLFGIVHLYQGVSGMIATGLTGLVFAGVYLASGKNLWMAIIAHGVMNTTGFVMMYFGVYPGI